MTSQIRRSTISIPSNIAEGYGRKSTDDYLRFLQIAISSLYEMQTQLEISLNLKYLSMNNYEKAYELSREIERMLSSLIRKIKNKVKKGSVPFFNFVPFFYQLNFNENLWVFPNSEENGVNP